MTVPLLPRPTYQPDLFLNRQEEIAQFNQLLEQTRRDRAGIKRVLAFQGERGIGKSWLLQHLHHLAQAQSDIASVLIRFAPKPGIEEPVFLVDKKPNECTIECALNPFTETSETPDKPHRTLIRNLLEWLLGYLVTKGLYSTKPTLDHSEDELSYLIVRQLSSNLKPQKYVLLLLVDSVYEADWRIVKWLEEYVLAPLIALDRVVIVLSGRGQPYPWTNSLLRIEPVPGVLQRWEESQEKAIIDQRREWLRDLVQKQVQEHPFWTLPESEPTDQPHISSDQEARLNHIWRIAQGHPWLTVLLASNKKNDDQSDAAILNRFVEEVLLSSLPEEHRDTLRRYLEAVCVLEYFRETEMEQMIKGYLPGTGTPPESEQHSVRVILRDLQRSYLVRWDRQKYQYFVDDTMRITLSGWLLLTAPERWSALHAEAQKMYEEWAETYPVHGDHYRQRAAFHVQALTKAKLDDHVAQIPVA